MMEECLVEWFYNPWQFMLDPDVGEKLSTEAASAEFRSDWGLDDDGPVENT